MYIKDSHLKHLSKIDKVQKRLIRKYDKPQLSKSEDFILDLCKYIIFQQISTKAGNSIYQRFIDFYNLNKNEIILWKEEDCKKIGLSKQKKNYIENIFNEKNSINNLYDCTDQSIIRSKLIKIKGVGNWTIDMFMIFTKGDLNIFPEGDFKTKVPQNAKNTMISNAGMNLLFILVLKNTFGERYKKTLCLQQAPEGSREALRSCSGQLAGRLTCFK